MKCEGVKNYTKLGQPAKEIAKIEVNCYGIQNSSDCQGIWMNLWPY